MNEPRESKPLMVLDLDHTLLDFSSKALQREGVGGTLASTAIVKAMKRPYMDSFLTSAYQYYDLVVWSQTSWRWLETKLIELGMLTHAGYKFCFVLDKTSMFSVVSTKRDGTSHVHHVKPLQLIWTKFPRWGSHNTVHLDDLSRNFALNLSSGLRVTAYYRKKKSVGQGANDVELLSLENYLLQLAKSGLNFEHVDFGQWLDVVKGTKSLEGTFKMKSDKKP
jgi:ubiquitin-like domain-containing CTD phosphatase 1